MQRYDGVVGDITITSNRSKYGDFTLPYMMSGVSMIVPVADSHMKSPWWFLKPVTLKLWILMISLFLSKGLFVWFSEHENNPKFEGTFSEPMGKVQSFFFSIFVFAKSKLPHHLFLSCLKFHDCSTFLVFNRQDFFFNLSFLINLPC